VFQLSHNFIIECQAWWT